MKKFFAITLLVILPLVFSPFGMISGEITNPLQGRIIALDAGHGGDDLGAQYPANCASDPSVDCQVYEKDVNLAVVYALKDKLVGACVVLTRVDDKTITSRKERVDIAKEKCQSECKGECDVLVSVHHNGSTDPTYDGTLVIYNEKQDIPLANALHDALILALGLPDKGLDHGGYGMTVYGHLVSAITEAYYITNDWEAEQYYYSIDQDGNGIIDRIEQEADALYNGLSNYFGSSSGDGGKPNKCSPWPECNK